MISSEVFATVHDLFLVPFRNVPAPIPASQKFGDLFDEEQEERFPEVAAALLKTLAPGPASINHFYRAVGYPFEPGHFATSRFSDGTFPVLYTSPLIETTIHETTYHWGIDNADVIREFGFLPKAERIIYAVSVRAFFMDLSERREDLPELVANDYGYCQGLGRRIHKEGHPAIIVPSARHAGEGNICIFQLGIVQGVSEYGFCSYEAKSGDILVNYRDSGAESGTTSWAMKVRPDWI